MGQTKDTNPSVDTLCVVLADGDHRAGLLLRKIVYWKQYSTAKIPKVEGTWIAHQRRWWAREAQLSLGQFDRAIAKLAGLALIEKCQWWYGGRNILFTRPTWKTLDFLANVKTWDAVELIVKSVFVINDEHASSDSQISNEVPGNDEPGSAESQNSNNVKHIYITDEKKTLKSALTPSAKCAITPNSKNQIPGEDKEHTFSKKNNVPVLPKKPWQTAPSKALEELALMWFQCVEDQFPEPDWPKSTHDLSFTEIGILGKLRETLGSTQLGHETVDLTWAADRFFAYAIECRDRYDINSTLDETQIPSLDTIPELDHLFDDWLEYERSGSEGIFKNA